MRADKLEVLLQDLMRIAEERGWECRTENRKDISALILEGAGAKRRAMLSTPGDFWVSLDVDGGFSLDHFEEEISDADLESRLRGYLDIAESYLQDGAESVPGRMRGFESLLVHAGGQSIVLRHSVVESLRLMLGVKRSQRRIVRG